MARPEGGTGDPSQNERREPLLSVLGGGTRRSLVLRKALAPVVCGLLVAVAGCGGGEGVCRGRHRHRLRRSSPLRWGQARAFEARRPCRRASTSKPSASRAPRSRGKLNLATLGANARRATEDSTTVAYLEASDPRAARFTHPILETAEIPWISGSSGKAAMAQPPQAHRSRRLGLPASFAPRRAARDVASFGESFRGIRRVRHPSPKHSSAAPAARFGEGCRTLPTA